MPNIGPLELAIVFVIVLLIFGPKRLPSLGRSLGQGARSFKEAITGRHKEAEDEIDEPAQLPAAEPAPSTVPAPAPEREAERKTEKVS
jgi:sec-independent protein translocase protein TatA